MPCIAYTPTCSAAETAVGEAAVGEAAVGAAESGAASSPRAATRPRRSRMDEAKGLWALGGAVKRALFFMVFMVFFTLFCCVGSGTVHGIGVV